MAKRNRPPSDKELSLTLAIKKTDNRTGATVNIINTIIKYACIAFCFFCLYLIIKELAGKTTDANIVLKFLGDIKIDKWVAYIFGVGGAIYGISQRNLRRKSLPRIANRCDELERRFNSQKQSSQISPDGKTKKEDLKQPL